MARAKASQRVQIWGLAIARKKSRVDRADRNINRACIRASWPYLMAMGATVRRSAAELATARDVLGLER